jgi:hypothetical protein
MMSRPSVAQLVVLVGAEAADIVHIRMDAELLVVLLESFDDGVDADKVFDLWHHLQSCVK